MNRPTRKHAHLVQKVATKESRKPGTKLGKRTKRWRKWIESYKPVAAES